MNRRSLFSYQRFQIRAFDTETFKGDLKVITCSDGAWLEPQSPTEVLDFLWHHAAEINFFFNISYDFGTIVKPFLREGETLEGGRLKIGKYRIKYVNGKGFSLARGNKPYKNFFDISNFYHDGDRRYSLGELARAFLGEGKTDKVEGIDREKIGTVEGYYEAHREAIIRYSVQDAKLTARLAEYFIDSLFSIFGFYPAVYYSVASIAKAWLERFHPEHAQLAREIPRSITREVLKAYRGGIFLVRKLGKVDNAHEIDINSAYPAVISRLRRIDPPSIRVHKGLARDDYSFHYVRLKYNGWFPYRAGRSRVIYPISVKKLEAWVTGPELDYLLSHKLATERDVKASITAHATEDLAFPEIVDLYERRRRLKAALKAATDPEEVKKLNITQWILKLILNSLYGVFAQTRPRMTKFTNIFYAAYITALTRMKIWDAVDRVGPENIISIQTDALVYTGDKMVEESDELGGWKYEFKNAEVITFMNGLAVRNGVLRKRGFPTLRAEDIMAARGHTLSVSRERAVRVLEAIRQHKVDKISDFEIQIKTIDLRSVLLTGEVKDPEHTLTFEYLREHSVDVKPLIMDVKEKNFNVSDGEDIDVRNRIEDPRIHSRR